MTNNEQILDEVEHAIENYQGKKTYNLIQCRGIFDMKQAAKMSLTTYNF